MGAHRGRGGEIGKDDVSLAVSSAWAITERAVSVIERCGDVFGGTEYVVCEGLLLSLMVGEKDFGEGVTGRCSFSDQRCACSGDSSGGMGREGIRLEGGSLCVIWERRMVARVVWWLCVKGQHNCREMQCEVGSFSHVPVTVPFL